MRFDECARLLITSVAPDETMSSQDTPRVGVGDEDRATGGVEQDRVHGLRAESGDVQQLTAERAQRLAAQPLPAAIEPLEQPHRKIVDALRPEPVGSPRA